MEEDSTDRLWIVIRSLKSPEGKYVSLESIYYEEDIEKSFML
jgi:hypothetical protein